MKIIILHHHLNTGGVTQVIQNQLIALNHHLIKEDQSAEIHIIYDGQKNGWNHEQMSHLSQMTILLHTIPEIKYLFNTPPSDSLDKALDQCFETDQITPENTLIHCHNHSLGKNVNLPNAILTLAKKGFRLLLQPHDFAEDCRLKNFLNLKDSINPYPQASHIHYAGITQYTQKMLKQAGVAEPQLHYLPNPVLVRNSETALTHLEKKESFCKLFNIPSDSELFLYPVRGITRKNIQEILLLSALAPQKTYFGITRQPKNPVEIPQYKYWKRLSKDLNLPCLFEVGENEHLSFHALCQAADQFITTSINEGFGMVFLEGFLHHKPLFGRDLPDITQDFKSQGIHFNGLYNAVKIPLSWLDITNLKRTVHDAYQAILKAYQLPFSKENFDHYFEQIIQQDGYDFAKLPRPIQSQIITTVTQSQIKKDELLTLNHEIIEKLQQTPQKAIIQQNAKIIQKEYGIDHSGKAIFLLYQKVISSPISKLIKPLAKRQRLLNQLLDINRLPAPNTNQPH